ncbi:MAG: DUF4339 domain-containing protein [Calothrix sp. SM1_5_4]|nr:DUF4339 domain-containing protein [Calothrix sp. SM1_5_4]
MTIGPFSTEEVREFLKSGRIAYTEYCWKDGYGEWRRIGTVEEFNPKANRPEPAPPIDKTETAEELLRNVVEFKRPGQSQPPQPPPPPLEAEGEDLTKKPRPSDEATRIVVSPDEATRIVSPVKRSAAVVDDDATKIVNPVRASAPPPPPPPPARTSSVVTPVDVPEPPDSSGPSPEDEESHTRRKKRRKGYRFSAARMDWAIVAFLVIGLAASVFMLARHLRGVGAGRIESPPSLAQNFGGPEPAPPVELTPAIPEEVAVMEPVMPPPPSSSPAPPPASEPVVSGPPVSEIGPKPKAGEPEAKAESAVKAKSLTEVYVTVQSGGPPRGGLR